MILVKEVKNQPALGDAGGVLNPVHPGHAAEQIWKFAKQIELNIISKDGININKRDKYCSSWNYSLPQNIVAGPLGHGVDVLAPHAHLKDKLQGL